MPGLRSHTCRPHHKDIARHQTSFGPSETGYMMPEHLNITFDGGQLTTRNSGLAGTRPPGPAHFRRAGSCRTDPRSPGFWGPPHPGRGSGNSLDGIWAGRRRLHPRSFGDAPFEFRTVQGAPPVSRLAIGGLASLAGPSTAGNSCRRMRSPTALWARMPRWRHLFWRIRRAWYSLPNAIPTTALQSVTP